MSDLSEMKYRELIMALQAKFSLGCFREWAHHGYQEELLFRLRRGEAACKVAENAKLYRESESQPMSPIRGHFGRLQRELDQSIKAYDALKEQA